MIHCITRTLCYLALEQEGARDSLIPPPFGPEVIRLRENRRIPICKGGNVCNDIVLRYPEAFNVALLYRTTCELPHQHARGVSSVSGVPEVSSSIGMLVLLLQGEESRRDVLGRLIYNTDFYSFHFFNNCNEYKQVCVANSVK